MAFFVKYIEMFHNTKVLNWEFKSLFFKKHSSEKEQTTDIHSDVNEAQNLRWVRKARHRRVFTV